MAVSYYNNKSHINTIEINGLGPAAESAGAANFTSSYWSRVSWCQCSIAADRDFGCGRRGDFSGNYS